MGVASLEGGTLLTLWKVTNSDFTVYPWGFFGDVKKVVIDVWTGRWFALKKCFRMQVGKPFL